MKKINTIQIFPHSKNSFLLGEDQTYEVAILGYIDKNNPSGDPIFDPMDSTKIKIIPKGFFEGNLRIYEVQNDCECGVNINILAA